MTLRLVGASNAYLVSEASPVDRSFIVDFFSYYAANVLVGNADLPQAIEVLGGSLTARAERDVVVAVTGSASLALAGREAPLWQALLVPEGATIEVKCPSGGVAYIAAAGMAWAASAAKKPLSNGATVGVEVSPGDLRELVEELPARRVPSQILAEIKDKTLRAVLEEGRETKPLDFTVVEKDPSAGLVLEGLGDGFGFKGDGAAESASPSLGSLVKLDGSRLAVALDHSRFSGPVIGRLHPCDLDKVAWVSPGETVSVVGVSHAGYARALKSYLALIESVRSSISRAVEALRRGAKLVKVRVGDLTYEAWVEEVR
ncbi:MAG: hypothetical protein DRJ56_02655 [Thermoprotei archaeon]|nr:MAG: hypothetical protein DRJ56_02655 [Thermoprotei archaeon]